MQWDFIKMKIIRVFDLIIILISIMVLLILLLTYAHAYFIKQVYIFCIDFNSYHEAVPEMIFFALAISGLVIFFIREVKQ